MRETQIGQSRFLADQARQKREAGDAGSAVLLALEALPDTAAGVERPYVPEAEMQLDGAWRGLSDQIVLGHAGVVTSAAFSPDGLRIVTASSDRTARVWDASAGTPVGEPLQAATGRPVEDESVYVVLGVIRGLTRASYSPDGKRIVTTSDDGSVRIWDVLNGKLIGEPIRAHDRSINSVAFSPDGRRIVTASDDATARIWDVATGKPIGEPLRGKEWSGGVNCVTFSPDGKRIVTAGFDWTVRIWDARNGKPIGEPIKAHDRSVNSVAFSHPMWIEFSKVRSPPTFPCKHQRSSKWSST